MADPGAFVLVPGAGGAAWYWHRVAAYLAGRGYDAVPVELPGDDVTADLESYVGAIVEACAGRRDLVIVGQSLGGFSAAVAATRLPASQLVFVNAMIPLPGETAGAWWEATGQAAAKAALDAAEGRPVDADFDPMTYFLHDVPTEVVAVGEADEKEQVGTVFSSPAEFTDWPEVPIHVITGRDDRFFPADFQRRVARDRLGVEPVVVPGGHLVALARPAELTDALISCGT